VVAPAHVNSVVALGEGAPQDAEPAQQEQALPPPRGVTVLKRGWLHKLSYRGKGWKKRYVEVTDDCELRYGRLREGGSAGEMDLKGIISLDDCDSNEVPNLRVDGHEGRFLHTFQVSSTRSCSVKHSQWWIFRDYYFAAVDSDELSSWLEVIQHIRLTAEVEFIDAPDPFSPPSGGLLGGSFSFIDRGDFVPLSRQLLISTHSNMAQATRKLAEGVQTIIRTLTEGPPPAPHGKGGRPGGSVWMLGSRYDVGPESPRGGSYGGASAVQRAFRMDLQSRLWFTYRVGFKPIAPSRLTSDTGWGCMLRSGQMMVAQALLHHYLRRDWRLCRDRPPPRKYVEVLRWFADEPEAIFGIHRVAQAGMLCDRQVGQWFGPDTVCRVLRSLWHNAYTDSSAGPCQTAGYLLAEDRCIYRDRAEEAASTRPAYPGQGTRMAGARQPCSWRSLVVMVPMRLGVGSRIFADYIPKLVQYLRFPQSLGFVGGRPRHSYYFVAVRGHNAYYLDPHVSQPYQPLARNISIASFHSASADKMPLSSIDPSLALGFYCDDKTDFDDLCRRIANVAVGDSSPILTVADKAPDYLMDDGMDDEIEAMEEDGC